MKVFLRILLYSTFVGQLVIVKSHEEEKTHLNTSLPVDEQNNTQNELSYDGRIVNGTKAVLGQFPHQVSLRRSYNLIHFCGGSLISPTVVLTAGHCLFIQKVALIQPWTIVVVAGELEVSLTTISSDHVRNVVSLSLHEGYSMETYENDIALLHLETPFIFDASIQAIPLNKYLPKAKTYCQVAGWGNTYYNGSTSKDLLYVDLPILPKKVCRYIFPALFKQQFCAGYLEGQKDACQGDSGGGFVCLGRLSGIVSVGKGCGWRMLPGIYTDVVKYHSWINEKLAYDISFRNNTKMRGLFNSSPPTIYNWQNVILTILPQMFSLLVLSTYC